MWQYLMSKGTKGIIFLLFDVKRHHLFVILKNNKKVNCCDLNFVTHGDKQINNFGFSVSAVSLLC